MSKLTNSISALVSISAIIYGCSQRVTKGTTIFLDGTVQIKSIMFELVP